MDVLATRGSARLRTNRPARITSRTGTGFCKRTVTRPTNGCCGPGLVHVGCWAHARRKFVDAVKVNPKDGAAIQMVTRMDALFLVDRHARQPRLSLEERAALRRQHAQPWVDEIHSECLKLRSQVLPKSALGEAVNYTLNMWAKLRRCFDHAEVELSNNVAENSMRQVALGRKNWLHVGSAQAGPKVAAILSVVESCRRLGVPVKDYLLAVLPGLAHRKLSELASFHPGHLEIRSRLTGVRRTDTLDLAEWRDRTFGDPW
jgi:transposase